MGAMRILVVEDEERIADALKRGFEAEGFAVDVAANGTDGLWLATEQAYDAIVLDIMLPGINGLRVCRALRDKRIWTPILMLTAKDGELDETEALDTGADDFCPSRSRIRCSWPGSGPSCAAAAGSDRRCSPPATSRSTRPPAPAGRAGKP